MYKYIDETFLNICSYFWHRSGTDEISEARLREVAHLRSRLKLKNRKIFAAKDKLDFEACSLKFIEIFVFCD